jgi:hypothetical protein
MTGMEVMIVAAGVATPTTDKPSIVIRLARTLPIERCRVNVVVCIDLFPPYVGLALVFSGEPGRVVHIVAKNRIAILAVLPGIQNMLVPELVHFLRWRRKDVVFVPMGQRIQKAFVITFNLLRPFRAPAELFHNFLSHGT